MIDVALASLIEDMIEKAGADGVVEFWQRVGDNLASRMGKEAYLGWTSFNVAVREARTAFSIVRMICLRPPSEVSSPSETVSMNSSSSAYPQSAQARPRVHVLKGEKPCCEFGQR